MSLPRWIVCAASLAVVALCCHGVARADVDARALRQALGRVGRPLASQARVVAVVQHDFPALSNTPGLLPLTEHFSGFRVLPEDFDEAAARLTGLRVNWSPPRHLLLDRAMQWTRLSDVHQAGNGSGQGVVIGIIDTGVDLTHPDLRNADGTTRVAWLMDFSRTPAGLQPDLEATYACSDKPGFECEILSGADINHLLGADNLGAADLAALPSDEIGHGTHVASLAASNGLSTDPARYIGAAPEATLVVVRVTRQTAGVDDFDILLATEFVFERAAALGMPCVINLSLGSDFGPHDGTDSVGQALGEFLDQPGRAIVVAAGNSGSLYVGEEGQYPDPFGVHTDVAVRDGDGVRVPLLTPKPANGAASTEASVFVWIGFEPGSDLKVGLDTLDGPWVEPIGRGEAETIKDGELEVTLLNNAVTQDGPLSPDTDGAVVLFDGKWDAGRVFVLRLQGEGAANLWVQSEGDLGPEVGSIGALFPRATATQTINIPAVQPHLIAVGASINRDQWPTRAGPQATIQGHALSQLALLDSVAWFSSAGPTAGGGLKPDLLAPGAFVAGALSLKADPDVSPFSLFADSSSCRVRGCAVVDDYHAVTTGTSMSSPIVAGAAALLLQRDPSLTHVQIRQLLQAGARPLDQSVVSETSARSGSGLLDAVGSLDALELMQSPEVRTPTAKRSKLTLGAEFLRPTPHSTAQGIVQLRDKDSRPVGSIAKSRLALQVQGATLSADLQQEVPGLYSFELEGLPRSGGQQAQVTLLLDGRELLSQSIPIALDGSAANQGYGASGGCAVRWAGGNCTANAWQLGWVLGFLGVALCRRRRRILVPGSSWPGCRGGASLTGKKLWK